MDGSVIILFGILSLYVEPREPLHLYRVYCQLDGVFVVSVNT